MFQKLNFRVSKYKTKILITNLANAVPVNLLFRSASSNLNIQQAHDGAGGSVQESQSEDEPHILRHSVTKPIIQEVHEVITPQRRVSQFYNFRFIDF